MTEDTAAKNSSAKTNTGAETPSGVFRAPIGTPDDPVDVAGIPTDATPIGPRSKAEAEGAMAALGERLAAQQEMLFARGIAGDPRSVLLVLQGMDTAGKDGVIKHVVGLVDPGGISLASFKRPTEEELAHDFLGASRNRSRGPAGSACSTGRSTRTC